MLFSLHDKLDPINLTAAHHHLKPGRWPVRNFGGLPQLEKRCTPLNAVTKAAQLWANAGRHKVLAIGIAGAGFTIYSQLNNGLPARWACQVRLAYRRGYHICIAGYHLQLFYTGNAALYNEAGAC